MPNADRCIYDVLGEGCGGRAKENGLPASEANQIN